MAEELEISCTPPEIREAVLKADMKLLPTKSNALYDKEYNALNAWCNENAMQNITENVVLAYYDVMSKTKKFSTLWKSIIVPIYNGQPWIDRCFTSILSQSALKSINVEICVCNDASTDNTSELLRKWTESFEKHGVLLHVYDNVCGTPHGVGYAKNKAISISSGCYLCFQDVDDVMLPNRILSQYNRALKEPENAIIGSMFKRDPENSTVRYTKWANSLSPEQLSMHIYTSHGPTVIMPTWFCHRSVFDRVGGFSEAGKGTPEDLLFFYRHLDLGGKVCRVDERLLIYYYHPNAATFSIHEDTIWQLRLQRLEKNVLPKWATFTIWNAGKQGRKFYNSLSPENRSKVVAMCDVNVNLIGKSYTPYYSETRTAGRSIDIISFENAQPPLVICVKTDMSNGDFERNLQSLHLEEGCDYVYFS